MKSKSPVLKESKLLNTPKHLFSNTSSLLARHNKLDSRKSNQKNSLSGRSLDKQSKKSLNNTVDSQAKLVDSSKCNTTPTSNSVTPCHQSRNNLHANPKLPQQSILNLILSKIGNKENKQASNHLDSFCEYHPDKKAKYFIQLNDQIVKLCSKCSIEKASQGVKIQEFTTKTKPILQYKSMPTEIEDDRSKKEQELAAFKQQLNDFIGKIQHSLADNQLSQIEATINQLISNLLQIKVSIAKELQSKQQEQCQQLQSIVDSLNKMHSDISNNEPNILENMQLKPFHDIMKIYYDKIKQHRQHFSSLTTKSELTSHFENLIESTTKQFQLNVINLIKPPKNQVYLSFQNREIFQEALKSQQEFNTIEQKEQPFVTLEDEDEDQIESIPTTTATINPSKFQDLILKLKPSQQQIVNQQQQTLYDAESPHFKHDQILYR